MRDQGLGMGRGATMNRPALGFVRDRDKVLRRRAEAIDLEHDTGDGPLGWRTFSERMEATMRARPNGLGLAAPQVGASVRLVTVTESAAFSGGTAPHRAQWWATIVNPEIIEFGGSVETKPEGCLTFPHRWWHVPRHTQVLVRGFDPRAELVVSIEVSDPLLARLWQHEVDHLDGRLISEQGYEAVR